ncbi:cobalamin biosynthesis protein CobD/CbiB, partial [Calderihabitans maritimus]|uniref:cobalamin biosynthesis protein CobD/CbiB n=1 Tax=Calderihabitans maritimus TaxID=1246530 RepID=UPI00117846F3
MEPKTLVLLLAFILDQLIGDPGWLPHPTRWIGQTISFLERLLRPLANTARTQRLLGGLLVILVVGGSYLLTQVILQGAYSIGWGMGLAASVWLTSSTLATKELGRAAKEIYYLLQAGELDYARRKLSWIVGRDTDNLSREEIVRATVETVAEN